MTDCIYGFTIRDKYTMQPIAMKLGFTKKKQHDTIFNVLDKRIESECIRRLEINGITRLELHEKIFCVELDNSKEQLDNISASLKHYGFQYNGIYRWVSGKQSPIRNYYSIQNEDHENIFEIMDMIINRYDITLNAKLWFTCSYSNDILGEGNIYWCDECDRVAVKEEYIKDYAKKYKKKCAVNLRNGKFICVNCFNKKE